MIDRVQIAVRGGNGGNGAVSFRREKFIPRGGPDGGDGGQGGSVILLADPAVSTLRDLRYKKHYAAEHGGAGARANRHGKSGADLVIRVPVGTIVRRVPPGADAADDDAAEQLADLDTAGATVVAAYGGLGGKGNARFATSTNQAPRLAERGQRGQEATFVLDLKLISDVGIIGLPNAGKSTLISAVSAARPKIASYPFTTLEPTLGVVDVGGYESFVMADIPGLIEGAHSGVGLGHDFLRHVERTRLLVHLLDGAAADPIADLDTVNREIALFSEALAQRPQIVAINKIDIPEAQERLPDLQARLAGRGIEALTLSAATGAGVDALVQRVWSDLVRLRDQTPVAAIAVPDTVLRPQPRARVTVEKQNGAYVVHGRRVETMAEMLDLANEEARAEFLRRLTRLGVVAALRRAGVAPGDTVRFGDVQMTWEE